MSTSRLILLLTLLSVPAAAQNTITSLGTPLYRGTIRAAGPESGVGMGPVITNLTTTVGAIQGRTITFSGAFSDAPNSTLMVQCFDGQAWLAFLTPEEAAVTPNSEGAAVLLSRMEPRAMYVWDNTPVIIRTGRAGRIAISVPFGIVYCKIWKMM